MTQHQCNLCNKLFSDPYFITCGHSFDKLCIEKYIRHKQEEEQSLTCPICQVVFDSNILKRNFQLLDLLQALQAATTGTMPVQASSANGNDERSVPQPVYEIYLLDASESMEKSDWLISIFGPSRFNKARRILTEMFQLKRDSPLYQIAFITFDTYPRPVPNTYIPNTTTYFSTVTQKHFDELDKLKPDGKHTAIYDAIVYCLNLYPQDSVFRLLTILTDGGDNLSSAAKRNLVSDKHEFFIIDKTEKLNIKGRFIHFGDRNIGNTKGLSDRLGYDFYHANNGNASTFTSAFNQDTMNITVPSSAPKKIEEPCSPINSVPIVDNPTFTDTTPLGLSLEEWFMINSLADPPSSSSVPSGSTSRRQPTKQLAD